MRDIASRPLASMWLGHRSRRTTDGLVRLPIGDEMGG